MIETCTFVLNSVIIGEEKNPKNERIANLILALMHKYLMNIGFEYVCMISYGIQFEAKYYGNQSM